jgi:hypothetical protein
MKREVKQNEKERGTQPEVDLRIEELEEVIAPRLSANHNETMVRDASH